MKTISLKFLKRWQLYLPILLMAVFTLSACEDDNGTETINPVYTPGESVILSGEAQDDDITLDVITDRNWTISIPEEATWLTVIKMGGNNVRIRVAENSDPDAAYRSAVVDIVGVEYIEQISVAQDVLRYVDVGDNQDVNLDPEGETDHTVPITSNVWETGQTPVYTLQKSEGSDWLTADIDGTDLLLSAGDNSAGTSMLTATVTVSATTVFGEVISRTIQVNQDTERSIELGDDVVMDRNGETVYIPIDSNVGNLGATISNMLGSWLTATVETGKLVLEARPFTNGTQPRSAVVTVTGITSVGVEIMDQVIVTQDIVRYLSFGDDPQNPVNDYTLATTGGDEQVNISTNVETSSIAQPLVIITSGAADWLTASITDGVLTLSAGDNSTASTARTATVSTTGTSIYGERITSNTMTVTQNMAPYLTIEGGDVTIGYKIVQKTIDVNTNAPDLTIELSDPSWLTAVMENGKLVITPNSKNLGAGPRVSNVKIKGTTLDGSTVEDEIVFTQNQMSGTVLSISIPDFSESRVYNVMHNGSKAAEVCKEFLYKYNAPTKSVEVGEQSIVFYPAGTDGKADLTKGYVAQALLYYTGPVADANYTVPTEAVHGSSVAFSTATNSIESFTRGTLATAPTTVYFIVDDDEFSHEVGTGATVVPVTPEADVVVDSRTATGRDPETFTYTVVKIGTQYWMGENLKTSIYNDNTPIPTNISYGTPSYDKVLPAVMVYGTVNANDTDPRMVARREVWGCYYTLAAIGGYTSKEQLDADVVRGSDPNYPTQIWDMQTDKLSPTGWKIPTRWELKQLRVYSAPDIASGTNNQRVRYYVNYDASFTSPEQFTQITDGAPSDENITGFSGTNGSFRYVNATSYGSQTWITGLNPTTSMTRYGLSSMLSAASSNVPTTAMTFYLSTVNNQNYTAGVFMYSHYLRCLRK